MPLAERLKTYRDDLIKRGGRRLLVDIEPEANAALAELLASKAHGRSIKDVVSAALVALRQSSRK